MDDEIITKQFENIDIVLSALGNDLLGLHVKMIELENEIKEIHKKQNRKKQS